MPIENRCPECGKALPQGVPAWARQLTVADAMTKDPVTLGPEDTLMRAVEVMRKEGIRRIPITIGGKLVGLLAQGDLNRAQPSAVSDSEEEFVRVMEGTSINRIMIQKPVTVDRHRAPVRGRGDAVREQVRRPARGPRRRAGRHPHRHRPHRRARLPADPGWLSAGRPPSAMEDADVESSSDAYARRFSGGVGEWFLAVQRDATLDLVAPLGRACGCWTSAAGTASSRGRSPTPATR